MPDLPSSSSPAPGGDAGAPGAPPKNSWIVMGASVRGQSHITTGMENQDALKIHAVDPQGPIVAAIADGHGDARCFRSAVGSRLAVQAAVQLLREFLEQPFTDLAAVKRQATEELPRRLVDLWAQAVDQDVAGRAFAPEELEKVRKELGSSAEIEQDPRLAYGTTLVAAGIAAQYIVYVHVGDGDVITITDDDRVERPIPTDEQAGGASTSLCMHEAWRYFRVVVQPAGKLPVLVSLSTDGVANSFQKLSDLDGFLRRQLAMIRGPEGKHAVESRLQPSLEHMTREGSGDDVTWVMVKRSEPHDFDTLASDVQRVGVGLRSVEEKLPGKADSAAVTALQSKVAELDRMLGEVKDNFARLSHNVNSSLDDLEKRTHKSAAPEPSAPGLAGESDHPLARALDRATFFTWFSIAMSAVACGMVVWLASRHAPVRL